MKNKVAVSLLDFFNNKKDELLQITENFNHFNNEDHKTSKVNISKDESDKSSDSELDQVEQLKLAAQREKEHWRLISKARFASRFNHIVKRNKNIVQKLSEGSAIMKKSSTFKHDHGEITPNTDLKLQKHATSPVMMGN